MRLVLREIVATAEDAHGWSLKELALEAGIHPRTLANLMNNHTRYPRYHTIARLAQAAGMTIIDTNLYVGRLKVA